MPHRRSAPNTTVLFSEDSTLLRFILFLLESTRTVKDHQSMSAALHKLIYNVSFEQSAACETSCL